MAQEDTISSKTRRTLILSWCVAALSGVMAGTAAVEVLHPGGVEMAAKEVCDAVDYVIRGEDATTRAVYSSEDR